MKNRIIEEICFNSKLGRQMRLIAGPRQSGKTTIAKQFLNSKGFKNLYFNWDNKEVKNAYRQNINFFLKYLPSKKKAWVCFDEIHKMPHWKDILKSFFDKYENKINFIVTGSARLDWFRKSGDSLAGRFFLFHLFPLQLKELIGQTKISFKNNAYQFLKLKLNKIKFYQDEMEQLLRYSGFPEPLLKRNDQFFEIWRNNYIDSILLEDLRPISKLGELENITNLFYLLPPKVGSPLSINSLCGDIEASHKTVKNYLHALNLVYVIFSLKPYANYISRSIKKEEKIYFYDWTRASSESAIFENYLALELKAMTTYWSDIGLGRFDLFYVRNKNGKETDFLITCNAKPWLLLEAKLSAGKIDSHHLNFARSLGDIPFVQIVKENKIAEMLSENIFQISASCFLR